MILDLLASDDEKSKIISGGSGGGRKRGAGDSPGVDEVGVADVEDGSGPGQQGGNDARLVGTAVRATPPHDPMVTEHE